MQVGLLPAPNMQPQHGDTQSKQNYYGQSNFLDLVDIAEIKNGVDTNTLCTLTTTKLLTNITNGNALQHQAWELIKNNTAKEAYVHK